MGECMVNGMDRWMGECMVNCMDEWMGEWHGMVDG